MKIHKVKVFASKDKLSKKNQLAWKIAEIASDNAKLNKDSVDMVINRMIDNASVAIASLNRKAVITSREMAMKHPRTKGATLFGINSKKKFDCEWAAWSNGTAVRELDFHDTFLAADYSHPGDNIPALMAVAQQKKVSGLNLIKGIITAYEVQVNLVKGICLHKHKVDHIAHLGPSVAAGLGTMLNLKTETIYILGDKITGISSVDFDKNDQTFSSLIFKDENDISNYSLKINFPSRTPFLISTLLPVIATSIVFTLIIIIAYITTILLLLRQRQISQIKSDFINNMTHEFKTPIATIDLALSAIKNPKIIVDIKKVKKYLKMINDENNRMHDQVENVLMMSQLERKEIHLDKKNHDINELINLAISHVNLIIQNKQGKINFEKDPKLPLVRVNETHIINVFVNILDNAIKYNENQPEIIIKNSILENKLIIDITDNGIGMSKSTRSKIFDKFYRPQTGDLHNVKGHGLGLSYVKKIIDLHDGSINVASVLGKGSTFTIQLNLH
mgnify:CR=1 FL=1